MNARPDAAAPDASRSTPMMAQYLEIKTANPGSLLFYRMGDFYELFFDDAETASRALGIVLTKRGKHLGDDIPMCGVPIERADDYLHRLIALGHRVAVCEQLEDPAEAKKRGPRSVVRRDVVRLVTPGTITEERLLEPGRANALLAVQRLRVEGKPSYGLASLDISTGAVSVSETDEAGLGQEIARLEPREIVAPQSVFDERRLRPPRRRSQDADDAVRARGRRRRASRTAGLRVLWRRDPGRVRGFQPRRDRRLRAGARLCRAHPDRPASGLRPSGSAGARRAYGDRRRHPRQSGVDAHAGGRAARFAAGDHRSDQNPRRGARARRTARQPADRSPRHRRAARRGGVLRRRAGAARGFAWAARRRAGFFARIVAARPGPRRSSRPRRLERGLARGAGRRRAAGAGAGGAGASCARLCRARQGRGPARR